MRPPKFNLPLLLITAIGAVLRLVNIGYRPLPIMDEAWTLSMAQMPVVKIITTSLLTDYNPPIFYLAAHLAVLIGGASAVMVRIPSFISGVLLIPMVYLIGLEIEDKQLGLLCAGFTAILYSAVYFSDYARAFMMVSFVFAITILAFIRILKGKNEWIIFSISGLVALYVHAFAIVPLGLMVLYLIYIRNVRWRYLLGMVIGAAPFAAMMYTVWAFRQATGYIPGWTAWATPIGLAESIPLELFGFTVPLVAVLILYTLRRYYARYDFPLIAVPVGTCLALVALSPLQLLYAHYAILIMPMFAVLALVPVSEWIRQRNINVAYPTVIFVVLSVLQLVWWWNG